MRRLVFRVISSLLASYLLGGFLGGALAAKLKGIDLRRRGSGNMGTANVLRIMGPFYALGTLLIDVSKGIGAVSLGRWTGVPGIDAACGLMVVIGHNWPLSEDFRGGKGIATSLGTAILLAPKALLLLVPLWILVAIPTGYISLGSLAAMVFCPVAITVFYHRQPGFLWLLLYAIAISVLAVSRHRKNIVRLWRGEEHKMWARKREPS